MDKLNIINCFLERDILLSPDLLDKIENNFNFNSFYEQLQKKTSSQPIVLNTDLFLYINEKDGYLNLDWIDFDSSKVIFEKYNSKEKYSKFLDISTNNQFVENDDNSQLILLNKEENLEKIEEIDKSKVKIIFSYEDKIKKKEVQDFVNYFKSRYKSLKNILSIRQELQDSISIARLNKKQEREVVSIIGMVLDKIETKNKNIKLTLEDPTGVFDVLITKNNMEIYNIAEDIVLDEIIGINGVMGNKIIFCKNIYFPDIPLNHEFKKSPDEVYAVFISDIHFGIKQFLRKDFTNFIKWLNGDFGSQKQREIGKKVKYLFVTGDVVEGVGIYPGQENDLDILDIYGQYEDAARFFRQVSKNIQIIICGGNHDAIRMSEPQPVFDKDISKSFYEIPNLTMVSNPALVNIHSSENFPGFDVLMYHGASFIYYSDNVRSIRSKGGKDRCDLIMKFLLQKRHLAPSHSSTLYIPDPDFDPLVIEKIPDIFVSGHIHKSIASSYRNVTLINSSCWVTQTEDQIRRGIVPEPAKIPLINLQTREVKIMNFLTENENE